MDEYEDFLEREVSFEMVEDEGDKEERQEDESTADDGGNSWCIFVANIWFKILCDFFVCSVDVCFGSC